MMLEKKKPHPRRPFGVTVLAIVVLILSVVQWSRLFESIRLWDWMSENIQSPPPYYFALTGGLWGFAGLLITIGLILGLEWAPRAARSSGFIFALYYWLNFLMLTNIDLINTRWIFNTGLTIVLLLFLFQVLSLDASRRFFRTR